MDIEWNVREVENRTRLACERAGRSPDEVTLVAITKTHDAGMVRAAFKAGLRHFGENRVQEASEKIIELAEVRSQSTWHMVGHLQTNKVKTALQLFDIIQSVDSVKLAESLSQSAQKPFPVLVQVNIAEEDSKSGFAVSEVSRAISEIGKMPNLEIKGLMTIAPWVADPEEVRPVFRELRELRDALGLEQLSMGMTDDYEVAIEEGATLVRVGRALFGKRRV
ncbi:MAG: YggS family pyridoxal phosphate-dependent enzyme [Chloroflexota bacterium]|nr:YggS family pyridoxal phosphate-dependent enzyme [Chloroflexota bacterium]